MKGLLENLHLYEIVLLFLGVFLFIILSGALIYYVVKREEIKKLLLFFLIPIIMIGYPSIQEFQFNSALGDLSFYKEKIIENPNDAEAKVKMEKLILKVADRVKSPKDIAEISEAYLLLDKPQKAIVYADKALAKESTIVKEKATPSDQDKINKDEVINSVKVYKKLATLEEDINSNKISVNDTAKIKQRLESISATNTSTISNSSTKSSTLKYYSNKYLTKSNTKVGN